MFDKLKAKLNNIPLRLNDYWLCGDRHKTGVHYFYRHEYVDYSVGDEMTLPKTKLGYPIYEVLRWRKRNGDNAVFDDGRHYELKFKRFSSTPKTEDKL